MSKTKNIITAIIAVLALVLVVFVVLVETGIFKPGFMKTEPETVIESEVIVVSETNESGEVEYLTMVTKYAKPKVSSNHRYPTKKRTTTTVPTTTIKYVEQSSIVHITDPNGIPQFNDDGTPVTEVVTYTIAENSITQPPTAPPVTSAVVVTDPSGVVQTDASGNAVTELVTYYETTTEAPNIWTSVESTTSVFNIQTEVKRDDTLAQNIVNQINLDRQAAGLEPLTHTTNLKATARTSSMALALPNVYGEGKASGFNLITKFGGNPVYQQVAAANKDKIMSPDTTEIGVGVVKYNDQYYTTVIFN